MNKELEKSLNHLLLGDERFTECPHILTIKAIEKGVSLTEDCGDLKEHKISYEEIIEEILKDEEGQKVLSEIIKKIVLNNER